MEILGKSYICIMPEQTMQDQTLVTIEKEELMLLHEKAIYWPRKKALLIADLHIGKVTHFRNNNIPIPQQAADKNFEILENLVLKHKPKTVYFLGDLFHSYYNKEWEKLTFLLAKYPKVKFILITGNHDILKDDNYETAGIHRQRQLMVGPFMLTHHPELHEGLYNLCGHIHPGVRMRGAGRQHVKLPCFYFGKKQGILPAFGSFTGTAALKIKNGDRVFGIVMDQVVSLTSA